MILAANARLTVRCQAPRDPKALWDLRGVPVKPAPPVLPDPKVSKDCKGLKVSGELPALPALKASKAFKDYQVLPVLPGPPAPPVLLVLLAPLDLQALKGLKAPQDLPDLQAPQVQQVQQVPRALLAPPEPPALPVFPAGRLPLKSEPLPLEIPAQMPKFPTLVPPKTRFSILLFPKALPVLPVPLELPALKVLKA